MINKLTGFLYSQPNFLSGAARILDLSGGFTEYNESSSGAEADLKAIRADWRVVGDDLRRAVKMYEEGTVKRHSSAQREK